MTFRLVNQPLSPPESSSFPSSSSSSSSSSCVAFWKQFLPSSSLYALVIYCRPGCYSALFIEFDDDDLITRARINLIRFQFRPHPTPSPHWLHSISWFQYAESQVEIPGNQLINALLDGTTSAPWINQSINKRRGLKGEGRREAGGGRVNIIIIIKQLTRQQLVFNPATSAPTHVIHTMCYQSRLGLLTPLPDPSINLPSEQEKNK